MKCKKVTRVIYLSSEWSKKPSEDWAMTVDARGLMTPAAWKNKNISGKTVINNNAQGWRLRNVSLRIKLSISALVCLETWKESKNERLYEIFLYFCFVLFCFFPFSATANFWNRFWEEGWFLERKNRDRSNLPCRPDIFYVLLLLFYTRSSNSTRGRAQNRRESRQKEKTSRSMHVSMFAKTYDALHFRYSRPLLDLYETSN